MDIILTGYIGIIYWGNIGIRENTVEITIMSLYRDSILG